MTERPRKLNIETGIHHQTFKLSILNRSQENLIIVILVDRQIDKLNYIVAMLIEFFLPINISRLARKILVKYCQIKL